MKLGRKRNIHITQSSHTEVTSSASVTYFAIGQISNSEWVIFSEALSDCQMGTAAWRFLSEKDDILFCIHSLLFAQMIGDKSQGTPPKRKYVLSGTAFNLLWHLRKSKPYADDLFVTLESDGLVPSRIESLYLNDCPLFPKFSYFLS